MAKPQDASEAWRAYWTGTLPRLKWQRKVLRHLPSDPRCKLCNSPFRGFGGFIMRRIGKQPSSKNPNYCDECMISTRKNKGGAEVELTLLFADVRGSTTMAERMQPTAFHTLMNRFYHVANHILIESDALVDKIVGDEVIGLYPQYLGNHAARAVTAAQELLHATGHADDGGPWIQVGIGVHTGVAYVGWIGSEDTVMDITALGDNVNVTARLASLAGAGEVLVSEAAYTAAGLDLGNLERRSLELKGRSEPIGVRVIRVGSAVQVA
jgi:adenylate cyclase